MTSPVTPAPSSGRVLLGALFVVLSLTVVVFGSAIVSKLVSSSQAIRDLVNAVLSLAGFGAALWLIIRYWVRLEPAALGLGRAPKMTRAWLLGAGLGILIAATAFVLALLAGGYRIERVGTDGTAAHVILMGTVATAIHALFEEVAFRAGLIGVLSLRFHPVLMVFLTGAAFSVLHLNNEGASVLGAVNVLLVGAAFGFLYLSQRPPALMLVGGMHFGWNEALYRMGIPVSGTVQPGAFLGLTPEGVVWSGRTFGLEASPAATIVFLALLIASIVIWRGRRSVQ